jgi:hypothetical protein
MKNYLKFIVAVAGFTIATFSSVTANAKKVADDGCHCDSSSSVCGKTGGGDIITGTYS